MGEPVQELAGQSCGAQHRGPVLERQVRYDDRRAAFVALREGLEQQLNRGPRHPACRRTGPARHDTAWLILAVRPGNRASGDDAARPVHHHRG